MPFEHIVATRRTSARAGAAACAFAATLAVALGGPVHAQAPPALDAAAALLQEVTGRSVRPYSTRDFGRDRYAGARSAIVAGGDRAWEQLARLRARLPAGVVAFVGTTHSLADQADEGVELVVAPGKDQFDILRVAASDAVNYGKGTEDLIRELRAWDEELGIDIVQAETDTVVLKLRRLPKNTKAFARRVYAFCPDIVDQGTGDVAELEREIVKSRAVFLWWD